MTLRIALIGTGDEVYFWFGHIALIIDDSQTGRSYFYDYGVFSFDHDNFFFNFAIGRLLFATDVSLTERSLARYRSVRRSVTIYTLDVPPETRVKVRDIANYNVRPENRYYYYHHFMDNCSTRIRDLIDVATGGQFKEKFGQMPGRFTLRQHVRRHTWFSPAVDWILNFWMGQGIDAPITVWEEMFLPSEVIRNIKNFYYTDVNGVERRLVTSREVISTYDRPEVLEVPRKQWPRQLVFSLVLSAIFGFFFFLQSKNIKAGKILAGISMSFTSLVFGLAGLVLYFLSISTFIGRLINPEFIGHDYTLQNFNMLFCSPLLLAGVPLGICYAFGKNPKTQTRTDAFLRLLWLLTVAGIFLSTVLKLLPGVFHQNLTDKMLMLPIALIFSLRPWRLREALGYFSQKLNKNAK